MNFKDLLNIQKLLITTYSEKPSSESSQIIVSSRKIILIFVFYSILIFLLSILIINYTPVTKLFYSENGYQRAEKEQLVELNKKILFLSKEIENLKTTNERLKYAMILGDSNILKLKSDTPKTSKKKIEGNFFGVVLNIVKSIFLGDSVEKIFFRPLSGFISRRFNPENGHYGIDIVAKTGSPIYAAGSGYVAFADFTVEDGYMIIIIHPNDYISIYKHCSSLLKQKKDKIIQSELVALSGNSGTGSHGSHLHFELWKNGQPVDPIKHLIN
jgi:murein DD-endopeptidase MepM/ murein hydrolase activator NlpD